MRWLLPALVLLTGCAHSHRPLPARPVAVHVKSWTDGAEYELANAASAEADPAKRISLLDQWKVNYPETDFAGERQDMFLTAYVQLRQARQGFDVAQDILAARPSNFPALYATLVLAPQIQPAPTAPDLDTAEKAANIVIAAQEGVFAPANKPPEVTDAEWNLARGWSQAKPFAEQALIQIYTLRKDDRRAVDDLTRLIRRDPTLARASYQLGQSILRVVQAERRPEGQAAALYQFARAAAYEGPGGLPADQRQQILDYLTKAYLAFHGSSDGLDQLLATAKTSPFPPANFTIQSTVDIARQREESRSS
jgi:hypothetical protein